MHELTNLRMKSGRIVGELVEDGGEPIPVSCWPELVEQWGDAIVRRYLVWIGDPSPETRDAFYGALVDHHTAAGRADEAARVQEEWMGQPKPVLDVTRLAGIVV